MPNHWRIAWHRILERERGQLRRAGEIAYAVCGAAVLACAMFAAAIVLAKCS